MDMIAAPEGGPRQVQRARRRRRLLRWSLPLGLGVAVLAVAILHATGPKADAGNTAAPAAVAAAPAVPTKRMGRPLFFAEEFNGTSLDTTRWRAYHSTYGEGNGELACLTPANVSVGGGLLRITSKREIVTCPRGDVRLFSSGFIGSREAGVYYPRYGYYEMRARVPHGQGLWPAFWLRHRSGASRGEVDIMEYFHVQRPGWTTSTVHWNGVRNIIKGSTFFESVTNQPQWHVWGVNLSRGVTKGSTLVRFYLDNRKVLEGTLNDPAPMTDFPDGPLWDIAINQAVGGTWSGHPDLMLGCLNQLTRCFDPDAVQRAKFPATFEVDYVRVYSWG